MAYLRLDETQQQLATWAKQYLKKGKLKKIIYPELKGQMSQNCLNDYAKIDNGENSHYGTPTNPTMPSYILGGSSSGSAWDKDIIFDNLTEQTDAKSIEVASRVAYQCLHKAQEERPKMVLVIQELEKALNIQWEFKQKLPKDNENIMKMIEHREYEEIKKKDLYPSFSSRILLNNGKVVIKII
ncbi:Phloem protein 2-like protein [Artemisia annua]|uniref:Phloem protein 2-like protein n=1 Tax=Artemisia annua TaxID=35608 RepID=A0A2U1M8L6_ARTAN|nr:Phloem protein 2-like protein [Artemisia annua]